jgi:hypothetical protein
LKVIPAETVRFISATTMLLKPRKRNARFCKGLQTSIGGTNLKKSKNRRNCNRLRHESGQASEDTLLYIKGSFVFLIGLFGIIGSFGSVDLGLIEIGQALKQAFGSILLIAFIIYCEEVLCIGYHLLHQLFRPISRLSRSLSKVRR